MYRIRLWPLAVVLAGIAGCDTDPAPGDEPALAFEEKTVVVAGAGYEVAVADVNGDRALDLVGPTQRGILQLWVNTGDLFRFAPRADTVGPQPNYAGPGPDTYGVEAGDYDGDGDTDLVGSGGGEFYLFRNDGARYRTVALRYSLGQNPLAFALRDLNGDGRDDLAALSRDYLRVHFGESGGLNDGAWVFREGDLFHSDGIIDIADFTGDGRLDLAAGGNGGVRLVEFEGVGRPRQVTTVGNLGIWPYGSWRAGDFDGDGRRDLLALPREGGRSVLHFNRGAGVFESSTASLPEGVDGITCYLQPSGDFDGDGRDDIVYFDRGTSGLVVARNEGGGRFVASKKLTFQSGTAGASVRTADLDGDGRLDVLARPISYSGDTPILHVLYNRTSPSTP